MALRPLRPALQLSTHLVLGALPRSLTPGSVQSERPLGEAQSWLGSRGKAVVS